MGPTTILAFQLLLLGSPAWAQKVEVRDGNIYLRVGNEARQITAEGLDSDASLSADTKEVVFLRKRPSPTDSVNPEVRDIFVADINGANPHVVLRGPVILSGRDFADFLGPQFGAQNTKVYFLAGEHFATSAAVMELDLMSNRTRYITSGLEVVTIQRGKYAGDLIVYQQRRKLGVGFYFWFYLYTPDGKEAGVIGQDQQDVDFFVDEFTN